MKKIAIVTLLLVFSITNLIAKNNTGFIFSVQTGIAKPLSPENFSQSYRTGGIFGVAVGKQLNSYLVLQGALNFNDFTFDNSGYEKTLNIPQENIESVDGGGASILSLLGKMKLYYPTKPRGNAKSYFYGAIGVNRLAEKKVSVLIIDESLVFPKNTQTVLATEFGLGVDIHIENTILFIEIGANIGFTEDKSTTILPLKLGLSF